VQVKFWYLDREMPARVFGKFDLDQPISKPCPKKLSADCPVTRSFGVLISPSRGVPKSNDFGTGISATQQHQMQREGWTVGINNRPG
jgi:hypothetical protein